jgi:hypothetical protein
MSIKLYWKRYKRLFVVGFVLILTGSAPLPAQEAPSPVPVDLLLVDETQTLQASLLVNVLAATLKRTGLFEIEAVFARVSSSFEDPLGVNPTERRYEMVLVIPRGIEQGTLRQIWIVTCPLTHATRPEVLQGIQTIQ